MKFPLTIIVAGGLAAPSVHGQTLSDPVALSQVWESLRAKENPREARILRWHFELVFPGQKLDPVEMAEKEKSALKAAEAPKAMLDLVDRNARSVAAHVARDDWHRGVVDVFGLEDRWGVVQRTTGRRSGNGRWVEKNLVAADYCSPGTLASYDPSSRVKRRDGTVEPNADYQFPKTTATYLTPLLFGGANVTQLFRREHLRSASVAEDSVVFQGYPGRAGMKGREYRVTLSLSTGTLRKAEVLTGEQITQTYEAQGGREVSGERIVPTWIRMTTFPGGPTALYKLDGATFGKDTPADTVAELGRMGPKGAVLLDRRLGKGKPVDYTLRDRLPDLGELSGLAAHSRQPLPSAPKRASLGDRMILALAGFFAIVGVYAILVKSPKKP